MERHQTTQGVVRPGLSVLHAIFGFVWLMVIAGGLLWLSNFELTAGPAAAAPARWPAQAHLSRGPYTLVMAAHPRCPCTRASMDELALIMNASGGRMAAHVLFFAPAQTDELWWKTDLWEKAAAIPGVTPHLDRGGSLQRAFGATTSGTVVVYDEQERLRFRGGVTAARGHVGENVGRRSLIALMDAGEEEALAETPVFGCPLRAPEETMGDGFPRR